MKVYDFIIVFKRPNYRWVDAISLLLLLLAIIFFTFYTTVPDENKRSIALRIIIAAIMAAVIRVYSRKKKGFMPYYGISLFIAACGWTILPGLKLIALVYFLAALAEKAIIKFPQEVAFDEEGIVINSIPKKYFSWTNLANVILKDGILTIDFKNNKLIQKEIESYTSAKEEQEFNEFCLERLNAQRSTLNAES